METNITLQQIIGRQFVREFEPYALDLLDLAQIMPNNPQLSLYQTRTGAEYSRAIWEIRDPDAPIYYDRLSISSMRNNHNRDLATGREAHWDSLSIRFDSRHLGSEALSGMGLTFNHHTNNRGVVRMTQYNPVSFVENSVRLTPASLKQFQARYEDMLQTFGLEQIPRSIEQQQHSPAITLQQPEQWPVAA